MKPHSDMKLRDYARTIVREVMVEARPRHLADLAKAADQFCEWTEEGIAVGDVTPELIREFEGVAAQQRYAGALRSVMRTFDPVRFRQRWSDSSKKRIELNRGNGSEFLLANVYLNHYEPTALRSCQPNTKRLYKTTLLAFDRFLKRSATLDDLTDDIVAKFAAWRLRSVSKHSVNKDLFNLLALWRWCQRKGLVEHWPDVEMEKPPRRTPVAWTEAEMRLLYQTALTMPGRLGKHRARDWWAALLLVAWDSGERIGAIMALTWDCVDLSSRWVRFRAEGRKGGRDDSAVRLSVDAVKALRKLLADDGPVFPWPFNHTHLWHHLSRLQRSAGLPTDAKSKFHRIRKTVASYAEAAGANATAMLRHSKREITDAYLDPKICKRQQPADVLFRLTEREGAGAT